MIREEFTKNALYSRVEYSSCMRYRYSLSREWNLGKPRLLFLLLNPSSADEKFDDPTTIRSKKRASALGFGSMMVCNLFALRTRDPKNLLIDPEPIGPKNDKAILNAFKWIRESPEEPKVICGWGTGGTFLNRATVVKEVLVKNHLNAFCLGLTKNNHPKHPLYVSYCTKLIPWL